MMNKGHFGDCSSGIVGASLIIGITVAWAAMLLPAHGATAPGSAQAILRTTSNVVLESDESDRIVGTHSDLGDELMARDPNSTGTEVAKIPMARNPAFSTTVRY